jgi:Ca2+/Na+ antiporter
MAKTKRMSRRMTVLLWLAIIIAFIGTLIYLEQISLLYVVTTLALCALLLIVGFSKLEHVGRGDETAGERS